MSEDTVKKMDEAYELVKDGTISPAANLTELTGRFPRIEIIRSVPENEEA